MGDNTLELQLSKISSASMTAAYTSTYLRVLFAHD